MTTKHKVTAIEFDSENGHVNSYAKAYSIKEANSVLQCGSWTAPCDGCYDKTFVTITFDDGYQYTARIDLQAPADGYPMVNLTNHIRRFCLFSTGQRKPDHWTTEQYQVVLNRMSAETRAGYQNVLDNYELDEEIVQDLT